MKTPALPAPARLDHLTAVIRDENTIVVTGHFIDAEEGFVPVVNWATMTINLSQPLTEITTRFLAAPDNSEYTPCDLSEFYAHATEDDYRGIMIAEGKDPDAEFARWADLDDDDGNTSLVQWQRVQDGLPDPEWIVLVTQENGAVQQARNDFGYWRLPDGSECSAVTHWTKMPSPPAEAEV